MLYNSILTKTAERIVNFIVKKFPKYLHGSIICITFAHAIRNKIAQQKGLIR